MSSDTGRPTSVGDILPAIADQLQPAPTIERGLFEVIELDADAVCFHVPDRFETLTFQNLDTTVGPAFTKALEACRRLAAGELTSIILSGPTGAGKSVLAAATCNVLAARSWREQREADEALEAIEREADLPLYSLVLTPEYQAARKRVLRAERLCERTCPRWINVPRILASLRRQMQLDKEQRVAERELEEAGDLGDVLVLDDLGTEKSSDWTVETISEVVGRRYDDGRRTIVTTNLSMRELSTVGYGRVVSRLAEFGALVEMRSAKDFRMRRRVTVT